MFKIIDKYSTLKIMQIKKYKCYISLKYKSKRFAKIRSKEKVHCI